MPILHTHDPDRNDAATSTLTLRDRKKAKLRETAIAIATKLFQSQGYDNTTLEQVCHEAELSLRTLLRYFPTKEDLALAREIATLERFEKSLSELGKTGSVLRFWRDFVVSNAARMDPKYFMLRYRLTHRVPAVFAKLLTIHLQYEDLLTTALAREAGVDPKTDIQGQLIAGALVAGIRRATRHWYESHGKIDLGKFNGEVVDWAIKTFPSRASASASRRVGSAKRANARARD
jgi:AcrR family transcriptional regulator